ncbi:mercuric transport protein MerT [Paenibacillus sp. JMULE4]|uniref:Mercuric transport protein MerT n=2 Tax=Paenibacillus TaxID=44249 RepID=A0A7X2ZGM9_9BACL|nr:MULTISPECIES: mercuric transport protein MerT [Paenibacillus]MUG74000.1 mercuric transport protein MerT [Paenibacillus validus]NTZ19452.1 mercuric transport protein MerT [Paenibacillus sp. JMULE4]
MKEKMSSLATVFSAFVMSGCCLGPLILIPLGLTGFAGTLAIFATKFQSVLMIITVVLLAISFYYVYGRQCKKKSTIITLWISTVLVLGMFTYTLLAKGYV